MKKIIKRIFLVFCLTFAMVFYLGISGEKAYAEHFDLLQKPVKLDKIEEGWQRIDDSNQYLYYDSNWNHIEGTEVYKAYNGTWTEIYKKECPIIIKFKGTKFRIIGAANNKDGYYGSPNIKVTIDNSIEDSYNGFGALCYQTLLYEKDGLEDKVHSVVIENDYDRPMWFDAIDIDADGELLDANISLNKSDIKMNIGEKENLTVSDSDPIDSNKVTWTSSDPNICTVNENGEVTAVSEGTAQVTGTVNDGSNRTAVCNVKVIDNRPRILTIDMISGKTYTYQMNAEEINSFTTWYENRAKGVGDVIYAIKSPGNHTRYFKYETIESYDVEIH